MGPLPPPNLQRYRPPGALRIQRYGVPQRYGPPIIEWLLQLRRTLYLQRLHSTILSTSAGVAVCLLTHALMDPTASYCQLVQAGRLLNTLRHSTKHIAELQLHAFSHDATWFLLILMDPQKFIPCAACRYQNLIPTMKADWKSFQKILQQFPQHISEKISDVRNAYKRS